MGANWSFSKEDRASSYNWLPLLPEHARFATITLRPHRDSRRYSSAPRALLFGSAASVLHYTCVSRILADLACRALGIPMVGHIDDFGAICRSELLGDARLDFRSLCRSLGVALNPGKADAGNAITFLRLFGAPSPANGYQLRISLPRERSRRWEALIDGVV